MELLKAEEVQPEMLTRMITVVNLFSEREVQGLIDWIEKEDSELGLIITAARLESRVSYLERKLHE